MNETSENTDEGDKNHFAHIRTEMYDFFCELYTCEYLLSLFCEIVDETRAQRKRECIRVCTDNINRLYNLAVDLWNQEVADEMKRSTRRAAYENVQLVEYWNG